MLSIILQPPGLRRSQGCRSRERASVVVTRMTRLSSLLRAFRDVRIGNERPGGYGQVDELARVYLSDDVLDEGEGEEMLRGGDYRELGESVSEVNLDHAISDRSPACFS